MKKNLKIYGHHNESPDIKRGVFYAYIALLSDNRFV